MKVEVTRQGSVGVLILLWILFWWIPLIPLIYQAKLKKVKKYVESEKE